MLLQLLYRVAFLQLSTGPPHREENRAASPGLLLGKRLFKVTAGAINFFSQQGKKRLHINSIFQKMSIDAKLFRILSICSIKSWPYTTLFTKLYTQSANIQTLSSICKSNSVSLFTYIPYTKMKSEMHIKRYVSMLVQFCTRKKEESACSTQAGEGIQLM